MNWRVFWYTFAGVFTGNMIWELLRSEESTALRMEEC